MSYEIGYHPNIEKQLKRLPAGVVKRVMKRIKALQDNPRPRGFRKLKATPHPTYRIKTGDYRVIYTIDDGERLIYILGVVHRRDAY